jgi:hypothetical protein
MCSEFEKCTGFISVGWLKPADTNNYLNLYRVIQLLVSAVLGQSIPIMIFGIGSQQSILKNLIFCIV